MPIRPKPEPTASEAAPVITDEQLRALLGDISRDHGYKLRKRDPRYPKPLLQLGKARLRYARADVDRYVALLAAEASKA